MSDTQNGISMSHNPKNPQLQNLLIVESSSFASEPVVLVHDGVFVVEQGFEQSPVQSVGAAQYVLSLQTLIGGTFEFSIFGI